ncbi:MAG: type IV pilus assembly protein PilM [Acidimicrobiales bacterium]
MARMATRGPRRVALEISNSAVRMAEVAVSGNKVRLVNIGQVRLPPRAVLDGGVADLTAVRSAIERCVKEGGFSAKEVHLGIAGLRAITRELDMPHVQDNELDSAVRLQALDVIPFPVEKTLLSARPLEEFAAADGTPMRRVLLAAAHRDLVDPLVEAVGGAGLTPISVDLNSTALVRALYDPAEASGGAEAIVSIGSELTTVVVHEGGVPHFVRTIADGGDTVTAAVAGALDLPTDDAETTKRNLDQSGPHLRAVSAAASEASTSLVGEIRSSIEYYASLPGRSDVRKVTVTGGGSRLAGLLERLGQQLRAEVVAGSTLSRVDCSELNLSAEELARRDPLVAVVVGLALPERAGAKPLDLLPPEILRRRKAARTDRMVVAVAALIVLALIGGGVLRYLQVHNAENHVASLDANITTTQSQIAKYDTARKEVAQIQKDEAVLSPVVAGEVNWPAVLVSLAHNTPPGGVVTSISGSQTPPVSTVSATSGASPAAPIPPSQLQIATVSISVVAEKNYPYFEVWFDQLARSGQLQLTQFSPFAQHPGGSVTYSATLSVLGTIRSSRLTEFEVLSK